MKPVARELESIALAALAAIPLYFSAAVGVVPLVVYHLILASLFLYALITRTQLQAPQLIKLAGYAYLAFFLIDSLFISSLIRASSHLLFFIGVFLVVEAPWTGNYTKRLLVTFLIFVASVATSTHLSIVLFIIIFAFGLFRELIQVSHQITASQIGRVVAEAPAARPAFFYMAISGLMAIAMFPLLPRLGSPMIQGMGRSIGDVGTGLSETINFREARSITPDPQVVARVWMSQQGVPFFTPLRMRGAVYDTYTNGEWRSRGSRRGTPFEERFGAFQVARPEGFRSSATVQQLEFRRNRLLVPEGTFVIEGVGNLLEEGNTGVYRMSAFGARTLEYRVGISRNTRPLRPTTPSMVRYPLTAAVERMATEVIGAADTPREKAAKIETFLSTRFTYVPDPASIGRAISVDEFLLRERRGHCEYFAAGMVVLLTAEGVPARIVGGYYGGELNPLTGYFAVRRRDAHAWVEVFDGTRWLTYDPSPPSLRPGSGAARGLTGYMSALSDSVGFFWDRYVLTFGTEDQITLLAGAIATFREAQSQLTASAAGIRSRVNPSTVVAALAFVFALALLARLWRQRSKSTFDLLVQQLTQAGISVDPSTTPGEILQWIRSQRSELEAPVEHLVELYLLERFSPKGRGEPTSKSDVRRALARISEALR